MEEFLHWKERSWVELVFNEEGYGGGWATTSSREQLNVNVWRILIGGKPPTGLVGANNKAIQIHRKDDGER
jgi:hypothetical protein